MRLTKDLVLYHNKIIFDKYFVVERQNLNFYVKQIDNHIEYDSIDFIPNLISDLKQLRLDPYPEVIEIINLELKQRNQTLLTQKEIQYIKDNT